VAKLPGMAEIINPHDKFFKEMLAQARSGAHVST
jgi:hypothetical protein